MQTINLLEKPSRFSDTRTRYLNLDTLIRRHPNVLKIRPVYCFAKSILFRKAPYNLIHISSN